jgi:hypothetical protein
MAQNAQREFNESKFLDGFRGDVEMECKLAVDDLKMNVKEVGVSAESAVAVLHARDLV